MRISFTGHGPLAFYMLQTLSGIHKLDGVFLHLLDCMKIRHSPFEQGFITVMFVYYYTSGG